MTEWGKPPLKMTERGNAVPQNDSFLPLSFRAAPHCHSERSEESFLPSPVILSPSFVILSLPVILSEAKNLPSRPKSSVPKILRSEAPQNDREGKTAPQNDRVGKTAPQNDRVGKTAPQNDSFLPLSFRAAPHCHSERSEESFLPSPVILSPSFVILSLPVILSEAKNLPSRPKSSVPKILRSEAPQNDREGKSRSSE